MRNRLLLLITIIILVVSLTSCWDRKELNNLSIAMFMGFDKDGDDYIITVQIINTGEVSAKNPTTRTPITTYRTTGTTVYEAIRKMTKKSPKMLYLSHLNAIVFGEDLARDGIAEVLDFLARDYRIRTDFYILIAKNSKATEVLNILTPLEKNPADKIKRSLLMSERSWASTQTLELDGLIDKLTSKGDNPVLTGILIQGNQEAGKRLSNVEQIQPSTILKLYNLGAFKKDKLVGWLTEEESIGYNHIIGNVKSTVVVIPWGEDGNLAIETIRTSPKIKAIVTDGKPRINIEYFVEANIGEVLCEIDLLKSETIYEIEKILAEEIKKNMNKSIERAQKDFKSDIFGFGEVIHREDPKLWKELEEDWNKEFESLEVNIKVTARIRRLGTITNSF